MLTKGSDPSSHVGAAEHASRAARPDQTMRAADHGSPREENQTMTELGQAVGYRRVSTEEQAEHGAGLELQGDAIAATATELGLHVVELHADEGISGKDNLDARRGLARALDALEPGSALIVYRLDRLARDLIVQEQILADAWARGARVVSCSATERVYCQPDDPSDPARTLIRQVLGAVAAYERAMIRLRMTRGRRRRLELDGWAGGPEPYGYSDADERFVLACVSAARSAGKTWKRIAAELNRADLLKRNGTSWTAADVHRTWTRARAAGRAAELEPPLTLL